MVNSKDGDLAGFVVDAIQDAYVPRRALWMPASSLRRGSSDPLRVLDQRSCDEIDDGGTHCLGEVLGNRSRCGAGHDEFVAVLGH